MVSEQEKNILNAIAQSAREGTLGIEKFFDTKTEKFATLICTFKREGDVFYTVPLAPMFDENPMERYLPNK